MPGTKHDDMAIGTRIRRLRMQRGMSQEVLAGSAYSASYLSRIESGSRPAGERLLAALAERLGTTPEHLLTGVDPARMETAELQVRYAELALSSGEPADALARFQAALGLAAEVEQAGLGARALLGSARARESLGDLDDALDAFHGVVEATEPGAQSWLEGNLGLIRCYGRVGDVAKSIELGEGAVAVLRARGDWPTPDAVRLLTTLQAAYQGRGDLHHAVRLAAEAVALADQTADRRARASALWNTSLLNAELGAVGDAVSTAERALGLFAELDAERDELQLRITLARLYTLDGRADDALDLLARTEDLARADRDAAAWRHERARALLQLGRPDDADNEARAAFAVLEDQPGVDAADVCLTLARIERARAQGGASAWLARAAQLLGRVDDGRAASRAWAELGAELDAADDVEAARDAYRAAASCAGLAPAGGTRRPDLVR